MIGIALLDEAGQRVSGRVWISPDALRSFGLSKLPRSRLTSLGFRSISDHQMSLDNIDTAKSVL